PSPLRVLPSSHPSPDSTTPLPQTGRQSLSSVALAPGGQQPSPFVGATIGGNVHAALHVPPLTSVSVVHTMPSLHEVGQLPAPLAMAVSHGSPLSTPPSPQPVGQSESVAWFAPVGQQPSPAVVAVIVACAHACAQSVPDTESVVHATPSSQLAAVGQ